MSNKPTVPDAKSFFCLVGYLQQLHTILKEIHPSKSINDLKAYPLQIIERLIKECQTLQAVIEDIHDSTIIGKFKSSNCL